MQILIEVSFREEGTKRSGNTEVGFVFSGMQAPGKAFFIVHTRRMAGRQKLLTEQFEKKVFRLPFNLFD